MVERLATEGVRDARVLAALEAVPRHWLVPEALRSQAYRDNALPIGGGQTISAPSTVAAMSSALELGGREHVLEVGTGSGYQTAILSRLCREVVTVERLAGLSGYARKRLEGQGVRNVVYVVGDGSLGCPEHSPYDRILSAAASPDVPPPWLEQLAEGGIIVLPMGGRLEQVLARVTKREGKTRTEVLGGCRFVPLLGAFGFKE